MLLTYIDIKNSYYTNIISIKFAVLKYLNKNTKINNKLWQSI